MAKQPLILVIDDDEAVQAFAVDALRVWGYMALGATTPAVALDLIRNLPSLQVVLSDIGLGPVSGPALIRQALRYRPELKVVFMTGGPTDVPVRRTDPVLTKPFSLEDLRAAIEAALRQAANAPKRRPAGAERRRVTPI
jgi:two-component system, cell cycle sensor histidine kinase and response regulator CckA